MGEGFEDLIKAAQDAMRDEAAARAALEAITTAYRNADCSYRDAEQKRIDAVCALNRALADSVGIKTPSVFRVI